MLKCIWIKLKPFPITLVFKIKMECSSSFFFLLLRISDKCMSLSRFASVKYRVLWRPEEVLEHLALELQELMGTVQLIWVLFKGKSVLTTELPLATFLTFSNDSFTFKWKIPKVEQRGRNNKFRGLWCWLSPCWIILWDSF